MEDAHDPNNYNSLSFSPIYVRAIELESKPKKKKKLQQNSLSMALHPSPVLVFAVLLHVPFVFGSESADQATYIVHMDVSVMPQAFASHHGWYAATLDPFGAIPGLVYVYNNALHGFSAHLSSTQLQRLKKSQGFVSCHRDLPVKKDTTHTSQFLGLNAGSGLWPASDYGEDVIVGVIDSGVWPESASYRDEGMSPVPSRWKGECERGTDFDPSMCNRKLIGARSFNKGLVANNPNITITMNSTRDTDGHGTHTSSTVAGNYVSGASFFGYGTGTSHGVAPRARLAMYKVLWDEGGFTSDIIAGIDAAISDGVDIISISLGLDGVPLYGDPIAIATFAAAERGIFVATSTGNEGPYLGLLHNGSPWVLTIGASTVDRTYSGTINLGDGTSIIGQSIFIGTPAFLKDLPLVYLGACENKSKLQKAGHKIVVCNDSESLAVATENVRAAKVAAGLFISNDSSVEFFIRFRSPGAIISPEDGLTILKYLKQSSNPKATLRFQETILGSKPAPVVTTYTSRGPSGSCPNVLKPDIVAPGALILASWSNSTVGLDAESHKLFNSFNIISGSSMSCPHAAGVAALLKGAHGDWSPAAIRSAIMTTANPLDNTLQPITDMGNKNRPATPLDMGSGHIDPNRALDPGLIYDAGPEDYLRLLCAMNYTKAQILMITRSSSFDCSGATLDLNYPSFIAFVSPSKNGTTVKSVQRFKRTVTNVGDAAATYRANVRPVKGFLVRVVPNELEFKRKYEKLSFTLILEGRMGAKQDEVVHGSLSWVDERRKYVVRSPIVATSFSSL